MIKSVVKMFLPEFPPISLALFLVLVVLAFIAVIALDYYGSSLADAAASGAADYLRWEKLQAC